MNIEKLKKAAEWMGKEWEECNGFEPRPIGLYIKNTNTPFNPHEETGRHFLVEMEKKLTLSQFGKYERKMRKHFATKSDSNIVDWSPFTQWFKTAPTSLCFEKIMEVI